jgi:hypothetical protein
MITRQLFILLALFAGIYHAVAQGTAFTYQGRLNSSGSPASGSYDVAFTLFATNATGVAIAGPVTNAAVTVTNGLFTTLINFGNVFTGSSNWLEIAVSTNAANAFSTLAPRQQLTPTPYAIFAETASNLSGTIPLAQLSAAVVTNGASAVNFSGTLSLGGNLNLPATTDSSGIIYAEGSPYIHSDGLNNFFAGPGAGNLTMSGAGNVGVGTSVLSGNTTGNYNTANGDFALGNNTTGNNNTANGTGALHLNTSGSQNTANGYEALYANNAGSQNVANGFEALYHNTTGNNNTANGYGALYSNTTGYQNTANGYQALYSNTGGLGNVANGDYALYFNTTGGFNSANGFQTLYSNTTGNNNTADGYDALYSNTTGYQNTANGVNALFSNTNGNNNTANGYQALYSNTAGFNNTANGVSALYNNTGAYNTANGVNALFANTNGNNNTADGFNALYDNTSGYNNIADGNYALGQLTTGINNIALGYQGGNNFTGSESGNIDIGNSGQTGDNNIIRIGTGQTEAIFPAGCTVYTGTVALTSDRNSKENFTAVNARLVLDKVAALPVTAWNYKSDSKEVQHLGPMAQDFQAAFGLDGSDDKHISVVDEGGVALAAIQGLNQKVNEKDTTIQQQAAEINDLKQQNDALTERLDKFEQTLQSFINKKIKLTNPKLKTP